MQHKTNETTKTEEVLEISDLMGIPQTGYLRLSQILRPGGPLPISKSAWFNAVREKRAPAAVALGPRTRAWRARDIIEYLENIEKGAGHV
jgi:prophage regulatory protein